MRAMGIRNIVLNTSALSRKKGAATAKARMQRELAAEVITPIAEDNFELNANRAEKIAPQSITHINGSKTVVITQNP